MKAKDINKVHYLLEHRNVYLSLINDLNFIYQELLDINSKESVDTADQIKLLAPLPDDLIRYLPKEETIKFALPLLEKNLMELDTELKELGVEVEE